MSSTPISKLLIANRGEISVRISQAARELGIATVAIFSSDDEHSMHRYTTDAAAVLPGKGASTYLDVETIIGIAKQEKCDALHPGYGFLSENATLARRCAEEGIAFVGPDSDSLEKLGSKSEARSLAVSLGVPLPRGTNASTTLEEARSFFEMLGGDVPMVIKAVAGGGGRGIRIVETPEAIDEAYERCRSEALSAFGNDAVYVEEYVPAARHIEVQIIGDGTGNVAHLGERECSLQRQRQKIIEVAPSPSLSGKLRAAIIGDAMKMAGHIALKSLTTFEFLVVDGDGQERYFFMEANPRIQVEHTVTEMISGLDLVAVQLRIASGSTLADVGLTPGQDPKLEGFAMQLRVNMETLTAEGAVKPSGGTIQVFEMPSGPGLRVDTYGYAGYKTNPNFDSLIAKIIVHAKVDSYGAVIAKARRALERCIIGGVKTNLDVLQALLEMEEVQENRIYTRFIDENMKRIVACASEKTPSAVPWGNASAPSDQLSDASAGSHAFSSNEFPDAKPVRSPMLGTIISILVKPDQVVARGEPLFLVEAMKMEHVVFAEQGGQICQILVEAGATTFEGDVLMLIQEQDVAASGVEEEIEENLDYIRPDLAEVLERKHLLTDDARPEAMAKRHAKNFRSARENIADLVDDGTFVEFGGHVVALQTRRRSLDDLIKNTPADGIVTGIASVNGGAFVDQAATQCGIMSYDYTVLAGTQGQNNHQKTDRLIEIATRGELPLILFAEGGGGRPGDDTEGKMGMVVTFHTLPRLSGQVPLIGVVNGYCFAGNAAVLGVCDVIIATKASHMGMGGPAMITAGGLGNYTPTTIGPAELHVKSGVIDILVEDEADAVAKAKQYLSYAQGTLKEWTHDDQRRLRAIIPENRRRAYDVRELIETLFDTGSVLELKRGFGEGMVTCFARVEGRAIGVVANNPRHLSGAIDSDGADKASRFMQICDSYGIPILFLCDTPGIMVGPDAEKTALIRHCSRMFITASHLRVPFFTIITRKGYGLGAYTMAAGSFKVTNFTIAWPTAEFASMAIEGYVELAYKRELDAQKTPEGRRELYERLVADLYEKGKALTVATHLQVDDVIDPADTRRWLMSGMTSVAAALPPRKPFIDAW